MPGSDEADDMFGEVRAAAESGSAGGITTAGATEYKAAPINSFLE
ncbi:hypothetical protein [Streptomyces sp. NPDC090057]